MRESKVLIVSTPEGGFPDLMKEGKNRLLSPVGNMHV